MGSQGLFRAAQGAMRYTWPAQAMLSHFVPYGVRVEVTVTHQTPWLRSTGEWNGQDNQHIYVDIHIYITNQHLYIYV